MFQSVDIALYIIMVAAGRVDRDDAVNRYQSPLGNIQVANQLVPLIVAIYPVIHLRKTANVLENAWPCGDATQVAERKRGLRNPRCTKKAFMHEKRQRER